MRVLQHLSRRNVFIAFVVTLIILVTAKALFDEDYEISRDFKTRLCFSSSCADPNREANASPDLDGSTGSSPDNPELSLPPDYTLQEADLLFCNKRFGTGYLWGLSNTATSYCTPESRSALTCFRSRTAADGRVDSFCFAKSAAFYQDGPTFELECTQAVRTAEELSHPIPIPSLRSFHTYWYETGPGVIFKRFIRIVEALGRARLPSSAPTILVSREEKVTNPWHTLMEIFSLSMSLDTLRIAINPETGVPFLGESDNPRIIILDDHPNGPLYDVWGIFAPGGIARKHEISPELIPDTSDIIIPLPGGSNPFWQGDWVPHACAPSPLLSVFSKRILSHYGIEQHRLADDRPIVVTYSIRSQKRRLLREEEHLVALRLAFPHITIQAVDFALSSFEDQVKLAASTDILVGVHGAGLTHAMFMRPGSAVVEILPMEFNFMGFRNLAHLAGHNYFGAHASEVVPAANSEKLKRNWQEDDLGIEQERFVDLVAVAIRSMYNTGLRTKDVA
jgi:EGF domain-specific O-GlcNAc transferase